MRFGCEHQAAETLGGQMSCQPRDQDPRIVTYGTGRLLYVVKRVTESVTRRWMGQEIQRVNFPVHFQSHIHNAPMSVFETCVLHIPLSWKREIYGIYPESRSRTNSGPARQHAMRRVVIFAACWCCVATSLVHISLGQHFRP